MLRSEKGFGLAIVVMAVTLMIFPIFASNAQIKEGAEKKTGLQVTILLFSGRPDPTFVISEKEVLDELKNLLAQCQKMEKFDRDTIIPSILGYKGIRIQNTARIPEFPPAFMVYNGKVEVKNDRTTFLRDQGELLETFILEQARKREIIDNKLFDLIQADKRKQKQ